MVDACPRICILRCVRRLATGRGAVGLLATASRLAVLFSLSLLFGPGGLVGVEASGDARSMSDRRGRAWFAARSNFGTREGTSAEI